MNGFGEVAPNSLAQLVGSIISEASKPARENNAAVFKNLKELLSDEGLREFFLNSPESVKVAINYQAHASDVEVNVEAATRVRTTNNMDIDFGAQIQVLTLSFRLITGEETTTTGASRIRVRLVFAAGSNIDINTLIAELRDASDPLRVIDKLLERLQPVSPSNVEKAA